MFNLLLKINKVEINIKTTRSVCCTMLLYKVKSPQNHRITTAIKNCHFGDGKKPRCVFDGCTNFLYPIH